MPGIGAFDAGMARLTESGLIPLLNEKVLVEKTPLLGICLGMQLLFEHSEEDDADGIGLLPGTVERLPPAPSWPHMGWNTLDASSAHPLLDGVTDDDWFYFVHGYAAPPSDATVAKAQHGDAFAAVVAQGNVHGVQFHPEKSGNAGRRVLANFFALA